MIATPILVAISFLIGGYVIYLYRENSRRQEAVALSIKAHNQWQIDHQAEIQTLGIIVDLFAQSKEE